MAERYDAVIVGSGVGGAAAAHALVEAGMSVLMIERGVPVERGEHNWAPDAVLELSPYFTTESHYDVRGDDRGPKGTFQCVGGPAVFYVRDNGSGIDPRYHDQVFELFERLDAEVEGTGLGLPISRLARSIANRCRLFFVTVRFGAWRSRSFSAPLTTTCSSN